MAVLETPSQSTSTVLGVCLLHIIRTKKGKKQILWGCHKSVYNLSNMYLKKLIYNLSENNAMLHSEHPITVTSTAEEEGIRPVIVAGICEYNSFSPSVFIAFYIRCWSFSAVRWTAALLWLKVHFSWSWGFPRACGLSQEPTGRPPTYRYCMNLKRMHELSTKQQKQLIHSHFRGCAEDAKCLLDHASFEQEFLMCFTWEQDIALAQRLLFLM